MYNKACDGVIIVISLSLFLSLCSAFSLASLFLSRLTVKLLSSQDRLWVGVLQVGVGGSRSEWVASDRRGVMGGRGGVGSRGIVGSHGWPWVLLLVGVSSWLEFQRCFNRVSESLEFQRCFNGVSGWME